MFVHSSIASFGEAARSAISGAQSMAGIPRDYVITIGNFDGCHVGHQQLIQTARQLAQGYSDGDGKPAEVCVLTFEPRPAVFFGRQRGLPADEHAPLSGSLFAADQKIEAMAELGVDHLILQKFDTEFSRISPEIFFARATAGSCRAIVVGDDFHFGADRRGDAAFLKSACAGRGIGFVQVPAVTVAGIRASSSTLRRELIATGNVGLAARLLGREYAIDGQIEKGAQNGRRIGIRTANLRALDQIIPANGVYAGFYLRLPAGDDVDSQTIVPDLTKRDKAALPCVVNIGYRPTIDSSSAPRLSVEAHILDEIFPDDELYGTKARIYFAARLRDEQKFASIDALKIQIEKDIALARSALDV